jgi:hypothetical protein
MIRRREAGQAHNAGDCFQASMLDVILFRVILMKMSIDPNHYFVACATTGFKRPSAFSPAIPVVAIANDRQFVTDQTQQ